MMSHRNRTGRKGLLALRCGLVGSLAACLAWGCPCQAKLPGFRIEGSVETGLALFEPPNDWEWDCLEASLATGFGATVIWEALPNLQFGWGPRFSSDVRWSYYYTLNAPLVVRLAVPLSKRGHELHIAAGGGLGYMWTDLEGTCIEPGTGTSGGLNTTGEGYIGYAGPPGNSGVRFVAQLGTRFDEAASSDSLSMFHLGFLRLGASF
jgi:hypothetical protein